MPTFYLKYRPANISQLDLENIRNQLKELLSSPNLPHALLFCGPKGLGKTSAARIVAKSINCLQKKDNIEPCNICSYCLSVNQGKALDLIEIDAASNRGIEDIKELREKAKLAPTFAKKKVYLIDEVHMLTLPAFNALLKILEEPPSHLLFILCTTEPEKVPETILSRCQRFNFQPAKPQEILRSLQRIIKGEKIKIENDALNFLASHIENNFREAAKILQELSFKKKLITLTEVKKILGKELASLENLFFYIKKKDTQKALEWLQTAIPLYNDLKKLTENILLALRDKLLAYFSLEKKTGEKNDFNLTELKRLIKIFDKAGRQLKGALINQLPLEIALIEACQLREEKIQTSFSNKKIINLSLDDIWQKIREKIKNKNSSLEALLKSTKVKKLEGRNLKIEVFYPFHYQKLQEKENLELVEKTSAIFFNKPLFIKYELQKKEGENNV